MSELLPPTSGTQVDTASTTDGSGKVVFHNIVTDTAGAPIEPASTDDVAAVATAVAAGAVAVVAAVATLSDLMEADDATYTLATATNITSGGTTTAVTDLQGGSYIWSIVAAAFNGATITLQALAADGTTYLDVATATANENEGVVIGQGGSVRLKATGGAPTGVSSSLT